MFGKKPPSPNQPNLPQKSTTPASGPTPNLPAVPQQFSKDSLATLDDQTVLISMEAQKKRVAAASINDDTPVLAYTDPKLETADYVKAKRDIIDKLLDQIDFRALEFLTLPEKKERISAVAESLIGTISIPLNSAQHALKKTHVLDEILGFGPLELILADHDVSDIMINTHRQIYIEKNGKIFQTDVTFLSEKHLLNVSQRIVSPVGRRVDESSPMVDARLPDGSRFNAIIPPLALDGCLVSIRKFKKNKMPLAAYVDYDSMMPDMARFLEICGRIRLNIIISGGTGSGKTTLLNALSGHIDVGERVITIEDAAELQLHQPHVLRLETRPPNIEGNGEINQRMLVKNALRMRPDRIILGEIRGDEVIDVLAAMNTGHDGSMATIHANTPRDCLNRIENLVGMAGMSLSTHSLRHQISSAINVIVQIARMRDGRRRITHIEEIVGMENEVITTQTLFGYKIGGMNEQGKLTGDFFSNKIRPRFIEKATYFNLEKELLECLGVGR